MKPLLVRPRESLSHLSPSPAPEFELLPEVSDVGAADSGDAGTGPEARRESGADSHAGFPMRRTWHLASTAPPTEPGASPPSAPGSPPDIFKQLVDTWVERMERTNRQLEALVQRLEGGFPSYVPGDPDWERDHPEKDLW